MGTRAVLKLLLDGPLGQKVDMEKDMAPLSVSGIALKVSHYVGDQTPVGSMEWKGKLHLNLTKP